MNIDELIEELELLKQLYPASANLEVRAQGLAVLLVDLEDDGDGPYVELVYYRPWAIEGQPE